MNVRSLVRYMVQSPWIAVFFGKTKVYDIDQMGSFANAHDKVGGFDVPVNERMRMYKFDTRYLRLNDKAKSVYN